MAILFEWYETPVPNNETDETEKTTIHARITLNGKVGTDEIRRKIQKRSSLTETDVSAVLDALSHVMGEELSEGRQVHLDGIGYFYPTLKSEKGITRETDRKNEKVRLKGIKFRADRALKDEVGNVKLKNFRHSGHSGKLSDVEIDMRLKAYFAEHQLMTRADFQRICGFMRSKGTRTILAYIAADNTLASFASLDLAEMKAGMAKVQDSNVHFLVYIDDGKSPRLLELKNEKGAVVETVVETYGSRNSVGVSETQEVFAKVFSNSKYQADSYGLVYWSHGDGWLPYPLRAGTRWVGQDKGNGDNRMNISEFVEILKSAPHFDFILFDACFMQAVEVAYELRDYTDYCIGSPTEIPGPGASYDAVVPAMFSAENAAVNIAKAYYEPYAAKYDEGKGLSNSNWTAGASVCALRTDKLVDLARITKQVLPGLVDNAQLRSLIFDYDKRRGSDGFQDGHVGYYDMANMMKKITDNGGYLTWRQAFDTAVVYWATTSMNYSAYIGMFSMEGTNGVSCYIPSVSNTVTDKTYRSTEWYTSAGFAALGW